MDEFAIEEKKLKQAQKNFKKDSVEQEALLKEKLAKAQEDIRKHKEEESKFEKAYADFELIKSQTMHENDALEGELERYCSEKEHFDIHAQAIKEQGERDQAESAEIGHFKVNKQDMIDKLNQNKNKLQKEKEELAEAKVKLEVSRNQIKAKQVAIEQMRADYVKGE